MHVDRSFCSGCHCRCRLIAGKMQQFIHVHIIVIYSMIVVLNPYFKFCRQTFIYEKLLQFITVFMKLLLLSMQKTSDAS